MKTNRPGSTIIISLIVFFGVVAWMSTIRYKLVIPGKTNALYSLETAWSKQRVTEIISYWEAEGNKETAWKLNSIDLLMVLGYCPFFFFSVRWLANLFPTVYKENSKKLFFLIILIGVLDILEGLGIYLWLNDTVDSTTPWIVGILSFTKFLIAVPMIILVFSGFIAALIQRLK